MLERITCRRPRGPRRCALIIRKSINGRENRFAVVLGARPGLGTTLARRFAAEGYAVALMTRTESSTDAAKAELAKMGAMHSWVQCIHGCDAMSPVKSCHRAPAETPQRTSCTVTVYVHGCVIREHAGHGDSECAAPDKVPSLSMEAPVCSPGSCLSLVLTLVLSICSILDRALRSLTRHSPRHSPQRDGQMHRRGLQNRGTEMV